MNVWFTKYKVEIFYALCVLLLLFSVCYFFLFKSTIFHYQVAKTRYLAALHTLAQTKAIATSDQKTVQMLRQWQKNQPLLFSAVQTPLLQNQLIQHLTHIAQDAGFTIQQITPYSVKKRGGSHHMTTSHLIALQISGQYSGLFYIMHHMNQLAFPLTVISLKSQSAHQFSLTVAVRGFNAPH